MVPWEQGGAPQRLRRTTPCSSNVGTTKIRMLNHFKAKDAKKPSPYIVVKDIEGISGFKRRLNLWIE